MGVRDIFLKKLYESTHIPDEVNDEVVKWAERAHRDGSAATYWSPGDRVPSDLSDAAKRAIEDNPDWFADVLKGTGENQREDDRVAADSWRNESVMSEAYINIPHADNFYATVPDDLYQEISSWVYNHVSHQNNWLIDDPIPSGLSKKAQDWISNHRQEFADYCKQEELSDLQSQWDHEEFMNSFEESINERLMDYIHPKSAEEYEKDATDAESRGDRKAASDSWKFANKQYLKRHSDGTPKGAMDLAAKADHAYERMYMDKTDTERDKETSHSWGYDEKGWKD